MTAQAQSLQEIFQEWQATFPGNRRGLNVYVVSTTKETAKIPDNYDGDCSCRTHFREVVVNTVNQNGQRVVYTKDAPELDSRVCDRERAWRKYITARDGRNHHVLEEEVTDAVNSKSK